MEKPLGEAPGAFLMLVALPFKIKKSLTTREDLLKLSWEPAEENLGSCSGPRSRGVLSYDSFLTLVVRRCLL